MKRYLRQVSISVKVYFTKVKVMPGRKKRNKHRITETVCDPCLSLEIILRTLVHKGEEWAGGETERVW